MQIVNLIYSCPVISCPAFSCPAFSCLAFSRPAFAVFYFNVLQFHALLFGPSFYVLHFQSPRYDMELIVDSVVITSSAFHKVVQQHNANIIKACWELLYMLC